MRKDILRKLSRFEDLSREEVHEALTSIVKGEATEGQVGAFIMGMAMKGASVEEITAAAEKFREWATPVPYARPEELLDTAGTGGDKVDTFNVSTMAAFVAAAAGAKVAKHGNRAVSSKCGSADFVEALGAKVEVSPEGALELLKETNFAFLFAPLYHPAMKGVAKVRREVGVRSLFNLVGPLSNPARARRQLVGVYDASLVRPLAEVLKNLGVLRGFVVHGLEGLDEVSISGKTLVGEVREGEVLLYEVEPEDFGLKRWPVEAVAGGDCGKNAEIFKRILEGKEGPETDFLVLNAAFALTAAGLVESPKEGVELARETLRSGKVAETVSRFVELSNRLAT
ncbi:MAG: anthranilate phosphoribosyltransferase [Aquificae bacterium]|nr:anthranilate phosphoribosyltransferase [Aquificota bacterium]